MTAAHYPVIRCDGRPACCAEASHAAARTVTEVRRFQDDWHQRPAGRDICPECWKEGRR